MSETRSLTGRWAEVILRYIWFWVALTTIVVVLGATLSFTIWNITLRTTELFRPNISVTNIIHATINDIRRESKLVVSSAELTPEVEKSETYWFWFIYLGTTTARVKAPGSRVQYVIPLEGFGESNIEQDLARKVVRVKFPSPRLDETMVDINYKNLEEYRVSGWARFNKDEVLGEARKMLRGACLEAGRKPWVQAQVREDAGKTLGQLLTPLKNALKEGVRLEVELGEE